jgi:hypothetical protein
MTRDPVEILVQEVDDLLEAGPVGLYEFMEILKGEDVEGSRDQHRKYAAQALQILLDRGRGRPVSLVWAQPDAMTDLTRPIEARDFDELGDDPYAGISRD